VGAVHALLEPEVAININTEELGDLGLTDKEDDALLPL
jgi:hypothetical protein